MQKKILIISTVGLVYDGITNVILSYLQAMDRSGLDIYVVSTIQCENAIKDKLEKLGCHVVELPSRRTETCKYFWALVSFVSKNKMDVIHAHGNSGTLAIEMVSGWLGGCKKRIAHSHNTKCSQMKADRILRPIFNLFYTDAFACGKAAGRWLFGERAFAVLSNGRDIKAFSFNETIRERKRRDLNLGTEIAIGHVGGFFEQKNHKFLLEIYREILKIEPSARLFLIGDGPLKKNIEVCAEDMKDHLSFVGTTPDMAEYLNAMDGMLLPSLFEGLPLAAVEWQINGLPCILSDAVTRECGFADNCMFMSLEKSAAEWAMTLIAMIKRNSRNAESEKSAVQAKTCGFDIQDGAKKLRGLYYG